MYGIIYFVSYVFHSSFRRNNIKILVYDITKFMYTFLNVNIKIENVKFKIIYLNCYFPERIDMED